MSAWPLHETRFSAAQQSPSGKPAMLGRDLGLRRRTA